MKKSIGFIGIGTMGSRMSARFLNAGLEVTVFNRDKNKTKPLVKQGAKVAGSIPELVKAADYICISVSNDDAIKDVVSQIIQAGVRNKTILSLSTISPDTAVELDKNISDCKARFLDAPVSGSAPQVESAQLLVFASGEEKIFEDVKPILSAISRTVYYLGPAGNGSRMKLVTNTLLGLGAQSLAEALLLGQRMGISKDKMIEVLSESAVVSASQKIKMQNALADDYPVAFSLANMYKDYGLILEQAHATNTPMPATAAARQVSAVGMARKLDADFAVVIRLLEEMTRPTTRS
ncbi:MAG TPA: NAD(P)-dependent oxidoreductase [Candidatus Saccharimonadales bacterium]|nr:NAD(P)-dependent oxidoreductase [Candidatus Saccharimonadales bacterium]